MTDIMSHETALLPARWRVLSGSWLKVIAMAAMVTDHLAYAVLWHYPEWRAPLLPAWSSEITPCFLMRCIGRLAFPLFCFLLVEGFLHTRDRRRYGRSLLLFALLSEVPYDLMRRGVVMAGGQNVFFTLLLGFLALCAVSRWEEERRATAAVHHRLPPHSGARLALRLLGIIAIGIAARADYGVCGVSFILLLYVMRPNRILQAAIGCTMLPMQWIAGLAFIPMNMYNGRRGFIRGSIAKYAFYAFYPLHLLALYALQFYLGLR